MKRLLRRLAGVVALFLLAGLGYGYWGFFDARQAAADLAARADALIAAGRGGADLGAGRQAILLAVEDPTFAVHVGIDPTSLGAGATTITQSLSKRLAFDQFSPGIAKIRQTGFALGLETRLTKDQILALFLDSVPMGAGPGETGWIDGVFAASQAHFGASVDELGDSDFLRLVAVMLAPGRLSLAKPDQALADRVDRIAKLVAGTCQPASHSDVWLEGCAALP